MKPQDFVARLAPVDLDRLATIFDWLAAHGCEIELEGGCRVGDGDISNLPVLFRELSEACGRRTLQHDLGAGFTEHLENSYGRLLPKPQAESRPATLDTSFCPDCGHVHIDESECSFPIGGERICRCERKVRA